MTDDVQRRLADIEKRLARLEKLSEKPPVDVQRGRKQVPWPMAQDQHVGMAVAYQWCDCGRDVCRAPDCPTHKRGA